MGRYICGYGFSIVIVFFSRMRSEGFLFLIGGVWGRDRVRFDFGDGIAHARARSRATAMCPMRCALRIGLYWGCLVAVSPRCTVVIGGGRVVSDALCRGDWWWACRISGAVPWGFAGRASCGWRCSLGFFGGGRFVDRAVPW